MKNKFDRVGGISETAVRAKTGKTWAEWIAILDKAGAQKMTHQQIVAHLRANHKVGDWWQQMLTVGYEQARGKRKIHHKPGSFQISASKTVDAPVSKVYALWTNEKSRAKFLPGKSFAVNKTTRNKSMRAAWKNGASRVDLNFYANAKSKSQLTIQHSQLATARDADRMKSFWRKVLERFTETLTQK